MPLSYDPNLVMLSILVAITGALTGLTLTAGYRPGMRRDRLGLIGGAIVIGGSIWSMHFIGMLALRLPVAVNYDFIEGMLSLYAAILGTGFGLWIVGRCKLGLLSVPAGGLLMGGTIASMHYIGMNAMRGCAVSYWIPGVVASVGVAVIAASVALWFVLRKRGASETLVGGALLGITIPSMHYIGMVGTSFSYLAANPNGIAPTLSQQNMALVVASATFAICGVFLLLFFTLALSGPEVHARRA